MSGKLIAILILGMLFGGCASSNGYLPKHALTNPVDGMSIPHPVELEREGVKVVTEFTGVMDPGLWTEIVEKGGIWPVTGMNMLDNSNIEGFAYWAGLDRWGDHLIKYNFQFTKKELENYRFLFFNRDAGWAYQLSGNQVLPEKNAGKITYDSEKYERDEKYRKELFAKVGMSLSELDSDWQNRIKRNTLNGECFESIEKEQLCLRAARLNLENFSSVWEVEIGTPEWEEYKQRLAVHMPHAITMPNGEIRLTFLVEDDFKPEAVSDTNFTGPQRFMKNSVVPLSLLAMSGPALPWMAAANVAGSVATAAIDDSWAGHFARAKIQRHDLADNFRYLSFKYQELIAQKNQEIIYLRYILDKNNLQY